MYKLYYCCATAVDHDMVEIIPAESQEEATKEFEKIVEESDSWFVGAFVYELQLEGFDITVTKK